jgi:multimeric flavodoxin WrbA
MGKKIIVLTGSPRRDGNSDKLADAFIKGAEQGGHSVVKFETAFKNIRGCSGCNKCWSGGRACVIRDDLDELHPLLQNSDVLVFSSPLYFGGISAQLKTALDRLHCYNRPENRKYLTIKESVYLIVGHRDDVTGYDPPINLYKDIAIHMGWKDRGAITVSGVLEKSDIDGNEALVNAENLGRSL